MYGRKVIKMQNELREGYTTGSCAAAGVAAASLYLLTRQPVVCVRIDTPSERQLSIDVRMVEAGQDYAVFAARKDGGDDIDVTHGLEVVAKVQIMPIDGGIRFVGGEGVGTVTLRGLKLAVDEPAINPMPRKMMENELRKYFPSKQAVITVSIPDGEAVARKTFNPRLGIVGGLSVLGTTGIVRPMSVDAIIATVREELHVKYAANPMQVILTFGAMGEKALVKEGYNQSRMVQVSNYIGSGLDMAAQVGFNEIIIAGHTGKLIKVAAGIFNTHSAIADARAEIICAHAAMEGGTTKLIEALYQSPTTAAADDLLKRAGLATRVWKRLAIEASRRAERRAGMPVAAILLTDGGEVFDTRKLSA